ncbi:MAG: hypothetical protein HQ539_02045 [Parcubacteria group bacterium]|nr:hypothetical protein [Parcubacteria group bacterium]
MKIKAEQLFNNLKISSSDPSINSIKQGVKLLRANQQDLEVLHIYIDFLNPKIFKNKKRYLNCWKENIVTKLDEWIFDNLIEHEEYSRYLKKYLPLKNELKYKDVDEYILNKHYRKKATRTLSRDKKSFNFERWTKQRYRYRYKRKTNLQLKDGSHFHLDFRNSLESFFILKQGEDKQILAVGGSGSSGQRERYTLFTAIFYLLSKSKHRVKHHLLRYDGLNRYKYIDFYYKPIITNGLGSNYPLEEKLQKEIIKNGLLLDDLIKKEVA